MKFRAGLLVVAGSSVALSGCTGGIFGRSAVEVPPAAPAAPVVVDGMRTSYADIVERTSPAVVQIEARHKQRTSQVQVPQDELFRQFQIPQERRPQIERGVGSGVLVTADGTILTNHHVVDGADRITVTMSNNKSYEAKVVGSDQPSDLAVLKVDGSELPFVNLGDSDRVRVGDIVLAIGNPLGIGQTVTAGIISAKGRRTGLSDGSFEDFLQTDAPINRGNSGGALVNLNGELIGINSQILSGGAGGGNIGIAFSIPSNMAKSVMDQLLKDGKVRRGMLGVNIQNITDDLAESTGLEQRSGVVVSNVRAGSAAEKAGVKRNDVITAVNGEKIDDTNVLRNKIAGTLPGTEVKLTILRDGREMELLATLDEFDNSGSSSQEPGRSQNQNSPGPQEQSGKLGLSLQPLTEQTARRLGLEPQTQGVVVTAVDDNGPAAEAGVSTGDVILEIDRKPVATLDDVRSALSGTGSRPVLLLITRRGQTAFVPVRPQN
jgi:serine protease Do